MTHPPPHSMASKGTYMGRCLRLFDRLRGPPPVLRELRLASVSGVTPSHPTRLIRVAIRSDVPELMRLRSAVRENVLADPARVPASAYCEFLSRARIWVWDEEGIRGFCAADPSNGTIWALFVDPVHEGRGIGRQLLAMGLTDLREAGWAEARLSTEVGSRAERFYAREGWQMDGVTQSGECVFIKCLGGD